MRCRGVVRISDGMGPPDERPMLLSMRGWLPRLLAIGDGDGTM